LKQPLRHPVAGAVGAFHHVEADIAQQFGHRPGVDRRVGKPDDVLVGTLAVRIRSLPFLSIKPQPGVTPVTFTLPRPSYRPSTKTLQMSQ
jgi:hypothetical protein